MVGVLELQVFGEGDWANELRPEVNPGYMLFTIVLLVKITNIRIGIPRKKLQNFLLRRVPSKRFLSCTFFRPEVRSYFPRDPYGRGT